LRVANPNAYRNTDGNGYANRHANCDPYSYSDTHGYTYPNWDPAA
jgi:hypothetical protein